MSDRYFRAYSGGALVGTFDGVEATVDWLMEHERMHHTEISREEIKAAVRNGYCRLGSGLIGSVMAIEVDAQGRVVSASSGDGLREEDSE